MKRRNSQFFLCCRSMIRAAALILVFATGAPASAGSNPAAPTSLGSASHQIQQSSAARSAGAAPISATVACEHGTVRDNDARSFLDKLWTDPVAAFTAVLAASTVLLWWVTGSMADTSKRALLDLERPIVYGGVSTAGLTLGGRSVDRSILAISIFNHGRTIARLTRINWGVFLAPKGSIAAPIDPLRQGGRELPVGTVCVGGEPYIELRTYMRSSALMTCTRLVLTNNRSGSSASFVTTTSSTATTSAALRSCSISLADGS